MNESVVKSESYSCGACGGTVHFDPDTQNLKCEYCSSITEFTPPEIEIEAYDLEAGLEQCNTDWKQESRVIHCDSCGAETVLEGRNTSQSCAFCDSPHVSDIDSQPGIKPESLIPFQLCEAKAKQSFKKWIKGKFFADTKAKSAHRMDNIKGVYVPYWVFDTDTTTSYKGKRGKRVRTGSGKNRRTSTRWTNVSGVYEKNFRNVNICGSDQIKKMGLSEKMEYKFEELKGYSPVYLSGFVAEKYIRGVEDSWEICKNKIKKAIVSGIKRQIGGDRQQVTSMKTQYENTKYKHVLCPIFVSVYKYKDKEYPFIVNGQSGKIEGKYPLSVPKVIGAVVVALIVISLLIWQSS